MIQPLLLVVVILALATALRYIFSAFENAGFDRFDAFAILILPPILETLVHPLYIASYAGMKIYADPAGFFIPLVVSARLVASGRVHPLKVIVGIAILTYVCNKNAVVGHLGVGITDIITPIVVTSFYSLYASHKPAPLAYVSGTLGMIIGADILNIFGLSRLFNGKVIIIGGAGVFDAIYLVGVFAAFLDILVSHAGRLRIKESFKKPT